jgi:haloalkane dehalogenase
VYLFTLWDALDLGGNVILVLHDWGSVLGFDWARQHPDRVQGIAFMEGIVARPQWADFPDDVVSMFQGFRSPAGEHMVLEQNLWIEGVLPALIQRQLSDEEMEHYRRPFASPGEDRRPTLSWPRHLPVEGDPADVTAVVDEYGRWLAGSEVPKLFINAEPGEIVNDRVREIIRTWPGLTEATVSGRPLHPGRQPGRDRPGHRAVRPRAPHRLSQARSGHTWGTSQPAWKPAGQRAWSVRTAQVLAAYSPRRSSTGPGC